MFKGTDNWSPKKEVIAIKVIDLDLAGEEKDNIYEEISILARCDNKYIMKYYGKDEKVSSSLILWCFFF